MKRLRITNCYEFTKKVTNNEYYEFTKILQEQILLQYPYETAINIDATNNELLWIF